MTASREEIIPLEELSLNAHPPLQIRFSGGWLLGFSGGYTKRANSAQPLYHLGRETLEERVSFCEGHYEKHGLPPIFKLTPASPEGLDSLLSGRGYAKVDPTTVMTLPLDRLPPPPRESGITAEDEIAPGWREAIFRHNNVAPEQRQTAAAVLSHIHRPVICGSIAVGDEVAACGLCVLERGYAGLYEIVVDPRRRGQGLGRRLCLGLLHRARELGATTGYLQVVEANRPAVSLYQTLGFSGRYGYWYRKLGE